MKKGERHGMLVCIGKDPDKDGRYYLYKCDCGNVKSIIQDNVKRGATKSCGCYQKKHPAHITYGFSHTRIDNIYKGMVSRCYYSSNIHYKNYGGAGIEVCDEWKNDKTKFFEWAFSHGYTENLTLDRIDGSKGYSPDNCRWVTYKKQNNNRRNNRYLEAFGKKKTIAEWSDELGIPYSRIWHRLYSGWDAERALSKF